MLTTIEGIYENGKIKLDEIPPIRKKSKVLITFLEEVSTSDLSSKERKAGGLAGQVWMADDFNEPLDDLKGYM